MSHWVKKQPPNAYKVHIDESPWPVKAIKVEKGLPYFTLEIPVQGVQF